MTRTVDEVEFEVRFDRCQLLPPAPVEEADEDDELLLSFVVANSSWFFLRSLSAILCKMWEKYIHYKYTASIIYNTTQIKQDN